MSLRVAVITPYFRESLDLLRRCHDSVAAQTHPAMHVMVADGHANAAVDGWPVEHVRLPRAHGDIGSTPRLVGCYHAIGLGVDAVAFLDADNWYRDDHVARLVALCERTGAAFVSSGRMLCRLDGSVMAPCPNTDPERFVDTSCMFFARRGFPVLAWWGLMPPYAHVIGDRVMLHYVKQAKLKRAHSPDPTVFYRCGRAGIYRRLGEPVPDGVTEPPDYASGLRQWVRDGNARLD
jgi:hypothetical protein